MPLDVAQPPAALWRIARKPDPLAFPSYEFVGQERFDDPGGKYRVLYASEQRVTCFRELLAPFRPALDLLARVGEKPRGRVPPDWHQKRAIGALSLSPGQRCLDLRSVDTRTELREVFAPELRELGLPDLDLAGVAGAQRPLTQALSAWAFAEGYAALAYPGRHDGNTCWAIFETAALSPLEVRPIERTDPDLQAAARSFNLEL